MLNGLDLFSGIGGITIALSEWVRPVTYCEIDRYAQGVLLSRMADGRMPVAPIWDDVSTLNGRELKGKVDIIYGGFPCQDISIAGNGEGLEGKRSGLFYEIIRLVSEIQPTFIFLENVPAITFRGLGEVTAEITELGYDSRWTTISAAQVGAPHLRNRWFFLGYSDSNGQSARPKHDEASGVPSLTPYSKRSRVRSNARAQRTPQAEREELQQENGEALSDDTKPLCPTTTDTMRQRLSREQRENRALSVIRDGSTQWQAEPAVGRVVDGLPSRVDRIKGLGNAVVPQQAKEAFKMLMGLDHENKDSSKVKE